MLALSKDLARWLFGPPGRQRQRVLLSFSALGVYALFALVQHGEVVLDLIDPEASWRLSCFTLAGASLFYLVVRSGWNQRLGVEPSLSVPQMLFGMVAVSWSYAITGPARGAVVSIMLLILLHGMFVLPAAQTRLLALLGFGMLGGVMLWKGLTEPQHHDPRVEATHLVFAAIVMASATVLANRVGAMQRRLQRQKAELKQALAHIQSLATRDGLTGLLNRRAMLDQLRQQAHEQQRRGGRMALVLVDLDHFKRINDTLGHRMGDRVLQAFAEVATAEMRRGDVVARWGGEEFLLMLPDTSPAQAWHGVERIRQALREHGFPATPEPLRVTFSAGLSTCGEEADIEAAIELADQAMYRAKTAGRDRSEVDNDAAAAG